MKWEKAKDFLMSAKKIDTIVTNKIIEKQQWESIAENITVQLGERVQSSGSKEKMADAINRFVDLEKEINESIAKLISRKKEIISVIEQLPVDQYDILHKIYIQYKDMYDVAEQSGKSYSWAASLHGEALKSVQNILDGEND